MSEPHLPQLPENISFASELIKARNELGLTQSQLASKAGLSLSAVKAYEAGRNMPGARELRELCQALQISPNKLLFGREFLFEFQATEDAVLELPPESDQLAVARANILLYMLAYDEREALLTLARSLAIARHGADEVRNMLRSADLLTGIGRELIERNKTANAEKLPIEERGLESSLDEFMARQGHAAKPEKLPKK